MNRCIIDMTCITCCGGGSLCEQMYYCIHRDAFFKEKHNISIVIMIIITIIIIISVIMIIIIIIIIIITLF